MDTLYAIAGRCTTRSDGSRERSQYGDVLVLVKPDRTVLVHDADGYQPVAWLTRPETVSVTADAITAREGAQRLDVTVHEEYARIDVPAGEAGIPVGDCPDCGTSLVQSRGTVRCPDCSESYRLPTQATILEEPCKDCGLPTVRAERGATFDVCLDHACDSLDDRVRSAFDREWTCPACGEDLLVLRRGRLLLGCEAYPDCETGFTFPVGLLTGTCGCGLPVFETSRDVRCLDSTCRTHTVRSSPSQ